MTSDLRRFCRNMFSCLRKLWGPYKGERPKSTWIPQPNPFSIRPDQYLMPLGRRKLNKT